MMKKNNQRKRSMAKYILPVFLLLLLIANIWIRVSVRKADIAAEGEAALKLSGRVRYTLPEGSYEVEEPFGEVSGSSSSVPMMTWDRVYFNVKVTDRKGRQFYMAVRVQGKELEALLNGTPAELKGLGSPLSKEDAERQKASVHDASLPVYPVCLNDNNQPGL